MVGRAVVDQLVTPGRRRGGLAGKGEYPGAEVLHDVVAVSEQQILKLN